MNKELLLRVKAHILEEPRRLNMSNWLVEQVQEDDEIAFDFEAGQESTKHVLSMEEVPPCGTVACIAGWAVVLSGYSDGRFVSSTARRLLGYEEDLNTLFYPDQWSTGFQNRYVNAGSPAARAQVVADVIDDFIARHEASAKREES